MAEYTCKDCIHYCVCKDTVADENWTKDALKELVEMFSPKGCNNFKPAADVQEVRRGEWRGELVKRCDWRGKKQSYYQPNSCSVCHEPQAEITNYCPNCGAKMDGKDEEK